VRRVTLGFNIEDSAKSLETMLRCFERDGGAKLKPMESEFPEDLEIDLSDSGFIGPLAVASLCLLRRVADACGSRLSLLPPRLERLEHYCSYSGLSKEFGVGGDPDTTHPRNVTRPVEWFSDAVPRLEIDRFVALARTKMHLSNTGETDLKLALSEVEQNVIDHSESPFGGLMSARAFAEKKEVRFAVADAGVGFHRGLLKRVETEDDRDALRVVFNEKISSRSRPHNRGQGLQHLAGIVEITGGRLIVYSGDAFVNWGRNQPRRFCRAGVAFPGTVVFVSLPIREDDAEDVAMAGSFWDG